MNKKLISLLMVGLMLLCHSVSASELEYSSQIVSDATSVDEYKKQILLSFDIYASPDADGYISNGEFSKAVLRAMRLYEGENNSQAVQKLKDIKIIRQSSGFLSLETLKISDAYEIVLNVLGYDTASDYNGYAYYVNKLDIDNGVGKQELMTEGDCINLLYNMLTSPIYSVSSVNNDNSYTFSQGDIFAKVYLEAVFVKGKVVASAYASLPGYENSMKSGQVCVDSTFFESENTDLEEQLGKEIEIFGTKSGANTYCVCGYIVTDDASEFVVNLKDVTKVSGFNAGDDISHRTSPLIEYYDIAKNRLQSKKMSSDVKVIYNGMNTLSISNSDFIGENGNVNLRDTNSDGVYDVVLISRYISGRVMTSDTIYHKLVLDNGTIIDYSDAQLVEVVNNRRNMELSNITNGTVVGVYESKSYNEEVAERIKIEIFSNVINGTVCEVNENGCVVGIESGEKFDVLPSVMPAIKLGNNYDLVLDTRGVAVYVIDRGQGGEYIYFLLHKNDTGINPGLKIRAVNMNGEYKIYDVCSNVRYTGFDQNGMWLIEKSISESELTAIMDSVFTSHVLIKARFRNGQIAEIICAEDKSTDDYKGYTTDKFTMDYGFVSGDYARRTDRLGLNHKAISGTTIVVMDDLSEANDGVEVVRYSAGNSAVVSEESYYMENAWIYDANNKLEVGVFVMTYDPEKNETVNAAGSAVLYQATAMLVEDVSYALSSEGDVSFKVHGYMDGKKVSYVAKDDEVTQKYRTSWFDRHCRFVGDLKFGDIIVPTINSKGEMSEFYLLASPDDETTPKLYIEPTSSSVNTAYGTVINNYDNVVVRLECALERLFLVTDSQIHYVCDLDKQKIYLSDGSQFINDSTSDNPDRMFILRWGLYTKQTVLYRR